MDKEKILKALKCIADGKTCKVCSYGHYTYCSKNVAADAIKLIEELEKNYNNAVVVLKDHLEGRI